MTNCKKLFCVGDCPSTEESIYLCDLEREDEELQGFKVFTNAYLKLNVNY